MNEKNRVAYGLNDESLVKSEAYLKDKTNGMHSDAHFGGPVDTASKTTGPAAHCRYYAFGRQDPHAVTPPPAGACECGHVHTMSCPLCEAFMQVPELIEGICTAARDLAKCTETDGEDIDEVDEEGKEWVPPAELQDLLDCVQYHKCRYVFYYGHQARLCHEATTKEVIEEWLKADRSRVAIGCDFAMKVLSVKYRETMAEWFGKKGDPLLAYHPLLIPLNSYFILNLFLIIFIYRYSLARPHGYMV